MSTELVLREFERLAEAPDAARRLRRFVLDLAVRGKLSYRNPSDDPASQLLLELEQKMIESRPSGARRKPVRTAPLETGEVPFSIPTGWLWTRIRHVTRGHGQMTPSSPFTYIDVTAIDKESGRIGKPTVLAASGAPSRARKIVKFGDVLYSCVRPYLLNIAVVDMVIEPPPIASTAFAVLDGVGLVVPRYLWTVLRSSYFIECVEEKMRGQAYPAINDSDFALLPMPLPPLAEQHRIVAKVNELMVLFDRLEAAQTERDARRDRLRAASLQRLTSPGTDGATNVADVRFFLHQSPRLITKPEHVAVVRQTVLDLAVQGRLTEQDPTDGPAQVLLGEIARRRTHAALGHLPPKVPTQPAREPRLPANWEWASLAQVCVSVTDGDHQPPPKSGTGVPFLVISNVRSGRLDYRSSRHVSESYYARLDEFHRPRKGDVLYTLVGSYGLPVAVDGEQPFCVQRHIGILRPEPEILQKHLVLTLRSTFSFAQATDCATGIAQKTVPLGGLRSLLVPVPPLSEQHRIIAKVDELMGVCDELEVALASTQNQRGRLLESLLFEALNLPGVRDLMQAG